MLCHKPAICGDCVRAHGAVQQGRLAGYGITPYGPPPYQSHRVHRNLKEVWRAAPVIPCAAQHLGHYKATAAATRNTLSAHRNISESAVIQPDGSAAPGKCWLAGVGPGSWDHVTMKVAHLMGVADVIVYDDLGTKELLSAARDGCEQVYVGKRGGQPSIRQPEIDKLLVVLCKQGKRVLRLKGGCPSTFSRVSSEAAALAGAGCPFELVPGVSTATAAAVLASLPLTDSQLSGAYAVLTAHDPNNVNWDAFTHIPTLVILMGGRALPVIVDKLQATGWKATTPVAVIKHAGSAQQQVWCSTLSEVEADSRAGAPLSPCVIVVGKVAALPASWQQLQEEQLQL